MEFTILFCLIPEVNDYQWWSVPNLFLTRFTTSTILVPIYLILSMRLCILHLISKMNCSMYVSAKQINSSALYANVHAYALYIFGQERLHDQHVCCRQTMETNIHLLAECRFTRKIQDQVATWIGVPHLKLLTWRHTNNAQEWWNNTTTTTQLPRKAIHSLAMLIIWEIWKEQNARIFNRHESSLIFALGKIKEEVSAWSAAGATPLAALINSARIRLYLFFSASVKPLLYQ